MARPLPRAAEGDEGPCQVETLDFAHVDHGVVRRLERRALGEALGISATRAGQLLKGLAADGAIRVRAGKTGSVITLVPKLVGAC